MSDMLVRMNDVVALLKGAAESPLARQDELSGDKPAKDTDKLEVTEPVKSPKPAEERPGNEPKQEEADVTTTGSVEKGKPESIDKSVAPEDKLDNTDAVKAQKDMNSGISVQTDDVTQDKEKGKQESPETASVIVTERSKIGEAEIVRVIDIIDELDKAAAELSKKEKSAALLRYLKGLVKSSGKNQPGKRDGTGPFKGSVRAKMGLPGQRQAAGEECPAKDKAEQKEEKSAALLRYLKGLVKSSKRDMLSFLDQDRPEKVKDIYRALKREHPDMPAEMKARIAARQGKKGHQHQGPPYKGPLTSTKSSQMFDSDFKGPSEAGAFGPFRRGLPLSRQDYDTFMRIFSAPKSEAAAGPRRIPGVEELRQAIRGKPRSEARPGYLELQHQLEQIRQLKQRMNKRQR